MDISASIDHFARKSSEKIAIRFNGMELNYAQFEHRIARLASGLVENLGIRPGDRIAFLGQNSIELLQLLFACARIGAVFAPLSNRVTLEQIEFFLGHLRPQWLIADRGFEREAVYGNSGAPRTRLAIFDVGDAMKDFCGSGQVQYEENAIDERADAIIVYTSGTTGVPKGVVHSHRGLRCGAENSINAYGFVESDEVLVFVQIGHVGGLMIQAVPTFFAGATLNLHARFDAGDVLREIEHRPITQISIRPDATKAIFRHPAWGKADVTSLKCVNMGSTTVPESAMLPWLQRGISVLQAYGLSEVLPPAIITPKADSRRKLGKIGLPGLHCRAKIVDENFRDMPVGETGQIVMQGDLVFQRYFDNPAATEAVFHDGWFMTGDLGRTDEDGFFEVVGRIKDVVKVDSYAVYPGDCERILEACPEIKECAVVGRPDPETGEAVVACVVLKDNAKLTSKQIHALFDGRLAPYQIPTDIRLMKEIPLNQMGKINRVELRKRI